LSRTAAYLDAGKKLRLSAWYEEHFAEYRTQSVFAEGAGYLAAVVSLTPAPASFLPERLVPEIHVSERDRTRRGTLMIRSTDFYAGLGLGVLAQTHKLPGEVVDKLHRFAAARRNLGDLHDVYEGLAAQRSVIADELPASVASNLAATRSNRIKRQVEIEIAIAQIVHQQTENRKRVIDTLRQKWNEESEPELKIALGQVIVGSNLRIKGISLPVDHPDAGETED
jgi:hypothetical protein